MQKRLRKLCIPVVDLSSVDPELLAKAVAKLKEVKFGLLFIYFIWSLCAIINTRAKTLFPLVGGP